MNDSYPYRVLSIRVSDGTYRDHNFASNYRADARRIEQRATDVRNRLHLCAAELGHQRQYCARDDRRRRRLACCIPSAALRAARLQIVGSGHSSVPIRDILAEMPALVTEIASGTFDIDARAVSLDDVEAAWTDTGATQRIVIAP